MASTNRIDGISFRFDGPTGQNFVGVWPSISVFIGTGSRNPDSLSPRYSDNGNNDSIQVYGGSLTIVANDMSTLRPFEIRIPFNTPFLYEPSKGNLVVAFASSSGPTNLVLDGHFASGDSVGRIFGDGVSNMGTPDTFGLITRFDLTVIPEPSTWTLLSLGLGLLFIFRQRQSR